MLEINIFSFIYLIYCFFLGASSSPVKNLKRKFYLGDFKEDDLASPTKAKKVLTLANENVRTYRKKIKYLKQKNSRLKKRITSLKEVLNEIKKKSLITDSASKILEVIIRIFVVFVCSIKILTIL